MSTIAPASAALLVLLASTCAQAGSPDAASRSVARGNFVVAARLLKPLAERGHARAQAMLGFMYETGQGVPQAYAAASYWYRLAAEQGDTRAQYLLGLAYDKGHGVQHDVVAAYKWLDLATAHAPRHISEQFVRVRNAVASKMSGDQIAAGQWYALHWPAESDF